MTNREIAQEISNRIGTAPVPFDSVYSIALEIYHELGGEETQFDSVYSILLEILPLVEGGGNGKAIEIVDSLPEASENKEKFYRLSSDDNVYVSELKSRTIITTNRLPDEQQIDKAYLYVDGDICYYKGSYKIVCSDGEIDGYGWISSNGFILITTKDAVNITENSIIYGSFDSEEGWIINTELHTVTNLEYEINDMINEYKQDEITYPIIPAIYNAPESAQIGNAYLIDGNSNKYLYGYYPDNDASPFKIVVSDGEIDGCYAWFRDGDLTEYMMASTKKASDIFYNDDADIVTDAKIYDLGEYRADGWRWNDEGTVLTNMNVSLNNFNPINEYLQTLSILVLNAPDSEQANVAIIEGGQYGHYGDKYIFTGERITALDDEGDPSTLWAYRLTNDDSFIVGSILSPEQMYGEKQIEYLGVLRFLDGDEWVQDWGQITGYTTVKYQRTETTEEWDWEKIATLKDIKPAIIDVEDLPETINDSNKCNIYRVEGDSNYIATNGYGVLPDNEQINEAYFDANLDSYTNFYYKGAFKVVCTDGEYEGYGWYGEAESFNFLLLTESNAVDITDSDTYYNFNTEEMTLTIDWNNNTATVNVTTDFINSGILSDLDEFGAITKAEGNILEWKSIATQEYVDITIEDKANKVDYSIPIDMMTMEPDFSVIDNLTVSGIYNLDFYFDFGTETAVVQTGKLIVTDMQGMLIQSIMFLNANDNLLEIETRAKTGDTWTSYGNNKILPVWKDNSSNKYLSVYSANKVDSLISALEARIAALEGN